MKNLKTFEEGKSYFLGINSNLIKRVQTLNSQIDRYKTNVETLLSAKLRQELGEDKEVNESITFLAEQLNILSKKFD